MKTLGFLQGGSAGRVEALELLRLEPQLDRREAVGDGLRPPGSGDRDHHRRLGELPREGESLRRDAPLGGELREGAGGLAEIARAADAAERAPRQERDVELVAAAQ